MWELTAGYPNQGYPNQGKQDYYPQQDYAPQQDYTPGMAPYEEIQIHAQHDFALYRHVYGLLLGIHNCKALFETVSVHAGYNHVLEMPLAMPVSSRFRAPSRYGSGGVHDAEQIIRLGFVRKVCSHTHSSSAHVTAIFRPLRCCIFIC